MPQFDALKSPLLAYAVYNARFVPPSRWVTFSAPSSTLTNFPALVKARNYTNIANGYDVHFQDANGNELAFDLDWYDNSTKSGAWWVRIPTLSGTTSIKMCYGDAALTTNRSTPATVWADYELVYHFNVASTTQPAAKGSSMTFTRIPRNLTFAEGATGRSLRVQNDAGGSLYHGWNTPVASDGYRDFSILAIGTAGPGIQCQTDSGIDSSRRAAFHYHGHGITYKELPLTAGQLACVNFSYTHSSSRPSSRIRSNGQLTTGSDFAYTRYQWWIAGTFGFDDYEADEIRVRYSTVSDAWQIYEYRNTLLHDTYTTYGPEE